MIADRWFDVSWGIGRVGCGRARGAGDLSGCGCEEWSVSVGVLAKERASLAMP